MIIYVDLKPSVLESVKQDILEENFSYLVRSHKFGSNLVVMTRDCSNWSLSNLNLIRSDRAILQRLNQEVTQTGNLISKATKAIVIGEPNSIFGRKDDKIICVPIDFPEFYQIVKSPAVLVEDAISDAPIYELILKRLSGISVPFSGFSEPPIHGGGERIASIAAQKVKEQRIVFAVADSDRLWPQAESGKEKSLKSVQDKSKWPLYFFAVTPCREIENVFGLDVLSQLPNSFHSGVLASLIEIDKKESKSSILGKNKHALFFDYKKGLTVSQIKQIDADLPLKAWLQEKLSLAGLTLCSFPGFGEKVGSQILLTPDCITQVSKSVRSPEWMEIFHPFFHDLRWILASAPRQRT